MVYKSGFVSIIGRPNVGKSTLINKLVGEKINITSPRPQTTRNRIRAICTKEEGQIVFVDTPGIHNPRNELDEFMLDQAFESLKGIDLIIFLVEGTSPYGRGDEFIQNQIRGLDLPIIVAMTKIDKLNNKKLIWRQKDYQEKIGKNVIPVSAHNGKNINTLVEEIFSCLPAGPQYYPEDMITDQIEQFVIAELIREKVFYLTREEVPYGVAVLIEEMKEREKGLYYIRANIYVEQKSHKGIVIGKNGSRLKEIGRRARKDIEDLLQTRVFLDLWVKVQKNWRKHKKMLEHMGYKE